MSPRTSGAHLVNSPRLSQIDETTIRDHYHLVDGDPCFFFHEYTAGGGYAGGSGNQLIVNLKKSPSRRNRPAEYAYKERAIAHCAALFSNALVAEWASEATFVPVPPSKARDHPEYDDRMLQVCRGIRAGQKPVDVKELVFQTVTMDASHQSQQRHRISDLLDVYRLDEALCAPPPKAIAVVDDVLTAGTHFKAMQTILSGRFPGVPIVGLFVARVARPQIAAADVFGPIEI